MTYDPARHHRRSIRLKGYDYTRAGAYFITLVTHGRENLFGAVGEAGDMVLNEWGGLAAESWEAIARHFSRVELDEWVIMPNHLHGIIIITDSPCTGEASAEDQLGQTNQRAADASPQPNGTYSGSVGAIVQNFKSITTRKINHARATPGAPLWQRNYYERILRHERELNATREYIINNPLKWALDTENPLVAGARHDAPPRGQ